MLKRKGYIKNQRKLTFLGIKELKSLMESNGVIIRRRGLMMMARDNFNNKGDEASKEGRNKESSNSPNKDLAADNDAAKINILLLLLLTRAKKPALLCLI